MNAEHIPMYRRRLAAGLVGLVVLMGSAVSQQAFAQTIDYDTDDDNLIEVDSLVKLNAIRYDLDGDGTASDANYATAFPTPATSMGCAATCIGYELMANLDFDTNGDSEITTADGVLSWGEGTDAGNGWQPIGTDANDFTAEFHGNGRTISRLFINRTEDHVGLFGSIASGATVQNVGLVWTIPVLVDTIHFCIRRYLLCRNLVLLIRRNSGARWLPWLALDAVLGI